MYKILQTYEFILILLKKQTFPNNFFHFCCYIIISENNNSTSPTQKNVPKESTAKIVWKGVSVTKHIPLVMPQRESACVWLDGQEGKNLLKYKYLQTIEIRPMEL